MPAGIILNAEEFQLVEQRLAAQILENHTSEELLLIGIQRRGADIATRLAKILTAKGAAPGLGSLDINLYRDDWTCRPEAMPKVGQSDMPLSLEGKIVILVDDVLYTGRTIRAALEAILDYGRPDKVELLTFIDRGHRELPICATYVGRVLSTQKNQQVDVLLSERDGRDAVVLRQY